MVKRILSLLCFLLMLAGMTTALAKEKSVFPDAGVYFRTNEKGAINGNLSVYVLPGGKVFFEVFAMDYTGDESGLIPAMEKGKRDFWRGRGYPDNAGFTCCIDLSGLDCILSCSQFH